MGRKKKDRLARLVLGALAERFISEETRATLAREAISRAERLRWRRGQSYEMGWTVNGRRFLIAADYRMNGDYVVHIGSPAVIQFIGGAA